MVYDDYDMSVSARVALFQGFGDRFSISCENVGFKEPDDGSPWLRYDYIPADKIYRSLDRKCISLIGLVQIGVIIPPDSGMDAGRKIAKDIVNFFYDGRMFDVGYILLGASQKKALKSDTGWMIPIRFTMRHDEK
ncbi:MULTISPECIES: phage tail terminator-like protein [Gammaproteobacteria]|uniref:phage tail terminator-like protein n=1 Tax=Gammaproteobacteria TaxID=1236 RepID=UPI002FCA9CAA